MIPAIACLLLVHGVGPTDPPRSRDDLAQSDAIASEVFRAFCGHFAFKSAPNVVLAAAKPDQRDALLLYAYGCAPLDARWAGYPQREDVAIAWLAKQSGRTTSPASSSLGDLPPAGRTAVIRASIYTSLERTICHKIRPTVADATERRALEEACKAREQFYARLFFGAGRTRGPWTSRVRSIHAAGCRQQLRHAAPEAERVSGPACDCYASLLEGTIPAPFQATPWEYDGTDDVQKYCIQAAVFVASEFATKSVEERARLVSGPANAANSAATGFLKECEKVAASSGLTTTQAAAHCYCATWAVGDEGDVRAATSAVPYDELSGPERSLRTRIRACRTAAQILR